MAAGILSVNRKRSRSPAPQTTRKVFNAPDKVVQAPLSATAFFAGNTLLFGRPHRLGTLRTGQATRSQIEDEIKLMLDSPEGKL